MPSIPGKYQHYKNENVDEYFAAIDVTEALNAVSDLYNCLSAGEVLINLCELLFIRNFMITGSILVIEETLMVLQYGLLGVILDKPNVERYLSVPFMARKMMGLSSPLMEITIEGEDVTLKTTSIVRAVEMKFKLGVEYDEPMPSTVLKSITKIVNENELITESVIPDTGVKSARHYLFTDDECIVTLTHELAALPGKRYFKRLQ